MPLLVAHRGAMTEAPENTKSAFDRALAYPVDGIEFDVQITRDGTPVIFHDKAVKKINGSSKTISDYTFQELNGFDWGGWFSNEYRGEQILTLEQVLRAYCQRTHLFIEIKAAPKPAQIKLYHTLPKLVVRLIRKIVPFEFIANIYILSFDTDILNLGYNQDPELKYVLNVESPGFHPEPLGGAMAYIYGCCLEQIHLTREIVSYFHHSNIKVMTYSCNNRKQIDHALSLRTDVVMTDNPKGVHGYFSESVQNFSD